MLDCRRNLCQTWFRCAKSTGDATTVVRQELGIVEGDFLDIQVRSGEIVLKVRSWWTKSRHGSGQTAGNRAKKRLKKIFALAGCIIP